jgi:nitric oxide dioxygenase
MFATGDQENGAQAQRLAGAILAYAGNIDRLDLLGPAVTNISRRHVTTHVRPEHYPIVGHHLLKAIKTVLGDAATPEIVEAWAAAYTELADIMISMEKKMYADEPQAPSS